MAATGSGKADVRNIQDASGDRDDDSVAWLYDLILLLLKFMSIITRFDSS